MSTDSSSSFSTSEISAEILMFLISIFMVSQAIAILIRELKLIVGSDQKLDHGLLSIFKLFLPLLSYMDLQAQQQQDNRRTQIVLVWMVIAELINMNINLVHTWQMWDSIEQCIRIMWVSYLVFGSNSAGPLQAVRISLLVICSVAFIYEIFRWVTIYLAERSVRLGKNPQLIDLYMKQILEQDDFEVPAMMGPMASCKYLVFGEETIAFRHGSIIEGNNSNLDNLITVGQLYQPKSEDEAFTSRYPRWREICTSFALAKILRRRFAQFPLAEAGNGQALKFVLGLIGSNHDNANSINEEISDVNTCVFYIIQSELSFLSDILSVKKALLRSLKMSGGKLTNGESSLSRHRVIEQLSWACQPSLGSNTETILVWHIATTLFYQQNLPTQPLDSDPRVALSLSSYCDYLVLYYPQLLPDVVYLTKSLYQGVKEELSRANLSGYEKSTSEFCTNIRDKTWNGDSAMGKGVRLVKDLEEIARIRDHKQVWEILADFWVEMMLYVTPSDNVEGHRNILDDGQLITQLWALLTHAGIIARPHIAYHQEQAGSSVV